MAVSKKKESLCPLNNSAECEVFDIRPIRCRFYGVPGMPSQGDLNILTELSRTIFLALSGQFLPEEGFSFSVADTVSGKFIQKYLEKTFKVTITTRSALKGYLK